MVSTTDPLAKENRSLHRQLESLKVKNLSQHNEIAALRSELKKLQRKYDVLAKQSQDAVLILPDNGRDA